MATRIGDSEFQNAIKHYHLLCFQETFLKGNTNIILPGFSSGFFRNVGNGVAVFVREVYSDQIEPIEGVGSGTTVWVHAKLRNFGNSYCIACVYNPPTTSQNRNENFFDDLIEDIIDLKHRFNDPYFIVVGDFNSRIGSLSEYTDDDEDDTSSNFLFDSNLFIPRASCDSVVNTYGKNLLSFCRQTRLFLLNGRGTDPFGEFTYLSTRGMSTIDYGVVSPELLFDKKVSFFVREALSTLHRPVAVVLNDYSVKRRTKNSTPDNLITLPPKIVLNSDKRRADFIERFERYFPAFEPDFNHSLSLTNVEQVASKFTNFFRLVGRPFTIKPRRHGPVWYTQHKLDVYCVGTRRLVFPLYFNVTVPPNELITVQSKPPKETIVVNWCHR